MLLIFRFEFNSNLKTLIFIDQKLSQNKIQFSTIRSSYWVEMEKKRTKKANKSRMCGKGVALGLFPFDSLECQTYDFDDLAHI